MVGGAHRRVWAAVATCAALAVLGTSALVVSADLASGHSSPLPISSREAAPAAGPDGARGTTASPGPGTGPPAGARLAPPQGGHPSQGDVPLEGGHPREGDGPPSAQPAAVPVAAGVGAGAGAQAVGTAAVAEPASTGGGAGTPAEVVELPPGEYNRTVRVGPRQRTFTMVVPVRRPASQAVPLSGRRPALVVLLHGVGATAATFRAGAGFDGTAASLGAVAVYPDGVEGSWNDGRANVDSTAHREPVDDVGFLAAVIGQALAETGAEPSRVVVAGYSNGAMMASRLACERADLVAQVVLVGATAGAEFGATCRPSRPVAVHVLAGTADTVVPLGGGRVAAQGGRSRGSVLALERFVALWTAWNGCSAWSVTPAPLPWAGVEHRSGGGCAAAVEVFAVQGGGHDWFDRPGGARAVDLLGAVTGP